MKIEKDYFTVEFDDSQAAKEAVFNKILEFFIESESFCGESIMQSDYPLIYAPTLLSEIADDILKFKVTDKEDEL